MPKGPTTRTRAALADQLSALLSSDELPAALYNPLVDALNDLASEARVTLTTPEVLRVALPLMLARLEAADAKGGADA